MWFKFCCRVSWTCVSHVSRHVDCHPVTVLGSKHIVCASFSRIPVGPIASSWFTFLMRASDIFEKCCFVGFGIRICFDAPTFFWYVVQWFHEAFLSTMTFRYVYLKDPIYNMRLEQLSMYLQCALQKHLRVWFGLGLWQPDELGDIFLSGSFHHTLVHCL